MIWKQSGCCCFFGKKRLKPVHWWNRGIKFRYKRAFRDGNRTETDMFEIEFAISVNKAASRHRNVSEWARILNWCLAEWEHVNLRLLTSNEHSLRLRASAKVDGGWRNSKPKSHHSYSQKFNLRLKCISKFGKRAPSIDLWLFRK